VVFHPVWYTDAMNSNTELVRGWVARRTALAHSTPATMVWAQFNRDHPNALQSRTAFYADLRRIGIEVRVGGQHVNRVYGLKLTGV
jgi:hypothetical protein